MRPAPTCARGSGAKRALETTGCQVGGARQPHVAPSGGSPHLFFFVTDTLAYLQLLCPIAIILHVMAILVSKERITA
jgi:hypothetical protein